MNYKTEIKWLNDCIEVLYREKEIYSEKIDEAITKIVKKRAEIEHRQLKDNIGAA